MAVHVKSVFRIGLPVAGGVLGLLLLCFAATIFLSFNAAREAETLGRKGMQVFADRLVDNYLREQDDLASQLAGRSIAELTGPVPGTLKVEVVPMSGDIPTDLSFTEQDFLHRAQAVHGGLQPEASLQSDHKLAISIVKPVKSGDYLLLVKVSMEPLLKNLEGLVTDNGGSLLFQQKLPKDAEPFTLQSVHADGMSATAVSRNNPNWRLLVQPALPSPITLPQGGLLLFSFLGTAGALFYLLRLLDRAFQSDMGALRRVAAGEALNGPLHFAASQALWDAMSSMKPQKAPAIVPQSGVHAGNVAEIVQAAEASALLSPSVQQVVTELPETATVAEDEVLLPDLPDHAEEEVRELSALEFTLSKSSHRDEPESALAPRHVFRMYDVRGKALTELSPELAYAIGRAVGTQARAAGQELVVVGRDCRLSGEELCEPLMAGLSESGCDVLNIGEVPTPVLYHAAKNLGSGSGVMVTGSHNPAGDNGFKIMIANHTLVGDEIQALRTLIVEESYAKGAGVIREHAATEDYLRQITDDVLLARTFNVVVDGGNGVAGPLAVRMLEEMGCTVNPLYCDPDGNFPNHDPDPTRPENLEDLLSDVAISGADLGIALDGDGDRLVIVTNSTRIIPSDRLLMLFAREILATQPGADILFDVKCSRDLVSVITSSGGRPVMTRTGHAWLKSALEENPAPLAGEYSGHFIFCDRWQGFDDGLYAAARFLEILAQSAGTADDLFASFPERLSTPELSIPISEEYKFEVVQRLVEHAAHIADATVNTIDGLRVEWPTGWGLVRASNTGAHLVARFEANDEESLDRIKSAFRELLNQVDPMLLLPF